MPRGSSTSRTRARAVKVKSQVSPDDIPTSTCAISVRWDPLVTILQHDRCPYANMTDPEVVAGCCRETKHMNVDYCAHCQYHGVLNRHRRLLHVTEHIRTRKKQESPPSLNTSKMHRAGGESLQQRCIVMCRSSWRHGLFCSRTSGLDLPRADLLCVPHIGAHQAHVL